jgi:hypothetical protein
VIQQHLIEGKKQPFNLQIAPMNLFDLKGLAGIHIPHPPTPPSRVPKDVMWWQRNLGGQNMKPQLNADQFLDPLFKQMINNMMTG